MNLQARLRLDAAIAQEEGIPLDDFISRQEVKRNRWPRQHTQRYTPPFLTKAITSEVWPDL